MTVMHKHHIVPRYRCKELGIDPDFEENIVEVTREQHALIHWGYQCGDLEPLLEVCNPSPEILEMIALGDNRDIGAAVFLAQGEIDGIKMLTGKDNPSYKHGMTTGFKSDDLDTIRKKRNYYMKKYRESMSEEQWEKHKEYQKKHNERIKSDPEKRKKETERIKAWRKKNKDDCNAKRREQYKVRKENNKEKHKEYLKKQYEYNKKYRAKKKAEKLAQQTGATLPL